MATDAAVPPAGRSSFERLLSLVAGGPTRRGVGGRAHGARLFRAVGLRRPGDRRGGPDRAGEAASDGRGVHRVTGASAPRTRFTPWVRSGLVAVVSLAGPGWTQGGAPGVDPAAPCGSTEGVEAGPRLAEWVEKRKAKCAQLEPYRAHVPREADPGFREGGAAVDRRSINLLGLYPRIQTIDHRSQYARGAAPLAARPGRLPLRPERRRVLVVRRASSTTTSRSA